MLHEIEPHVFDNQMRFAAVQPQDTVLAYAAPSAGAQYHAVVAVPQGGSLRLPTRADYPPHAAFVYAFSIDEQRFFLLRREKSAAGGKTGRDMTLIKPDQNEKELFHLFHNASCSTARSKSA